MFVAALKMEHELLGLPFLADPTEALGVQGFIKAARRAVPHTPKRKQPITAEMLYAMRREADSANAKDHEYMTAAFCLHDGLMRFSETVKLTVRDVVFDQERGVVYIIIRDSKASRGRDELISLAHYRDCSAASMLRDYWMKNRLFEKPGDAKLFPNVDGKSVLNKSHKAQPSKFVRWLRRVLEKAGYEGSNFSGHSFRAGGAKDLWNRKVPACLIKIAGRWRSDCYRIYIRDHPAANAIVTARAFGDVVRTFGA